MFDAGKTYTILTTVVGPIKEPPADEWGLSTTYEVDGKLLCFENFDEAIVSRNSLIHALIGESVSNICNYFNSLSEDLDLKPSDIQGLIGGTKGILDIRQPISYDTEGGLPSADGAFLSMNFEAVWQDKPQRWDCNVWNQLSAWGQTYKREMTTQKERDLMTRHIYNDDSRIPADHPYFEMVGQIRLVHPILDDTP